MLMYQFDQYHKSCTLFLTSSLVKLIQQEILFLRETEKSSDLRITACMPLGAGAAPIDAPAAATAANENALGEDSMLGLVSPHWVPDSEAPSCMSCEERFTLVRRRHHCRLASYS